MSSVRMGLTRILALKDVFEKPQISSCEIFAG